MEDRKEYGSPKAAADRLREALAEANLSQRAAARSLGVDERTMRYWCAGKPEPPAMAFMALEHLVAVARGERSGLPGIDYRLPSDAPEVVTKERLVEVALHWIECAERSAGRAERLSSDYIESEVMRVAEAEAARDHAVRALSVLDLSPPDLAGLETLRDRARAVRKRASAVITGDRKLAS